MGGLIFSYSEKKNSNWRQLCMLLGHTDNSAYKTHHTDFGVHISVQLFFFKDDMFAQHIINLS